MGALSATLKAIPRALPRAMPRDPLALIGLIILVGFVVVAFIGPSIVPPNWNSISRETSQAPSLRHWFGTTNVGRDVLYQVVMGARGALTIGFLASLSVVTLGTVVGLVAGYFKGTIDNLLMRLVDIAYTLPLEPIAIVILSIVGRSFAIIILIIALLSWRGPARTIRAQVLSLRERPFVKAGRVAGAGHLRILSVYIGPNILPMSFMFLPITFGRAILAEASISFLGFGDPGMVTWGQVLQSAFVAGATRTMWWWVFAPGLCIGLVILAVYYVTRSFEDSLNPRLRGQ